MWERTIHGVPCQRKRSGSWDRGSLRDRIEALRNLVPELRQYVNVASILRLGFEHGIGRSDHSAILRRVIVFDCWLAALKARYLGCPPKATKLRMMQVERRKGLVR